MSIFNYWELVAKKTARLAALEYEQKLRILDNELDQYKAKVRELESLLQRSTEDVYLTVQGVEITFNHRTNTALLYCADPDVDVEILKALELHLKSKGYFLASFIGSPGMGLPNKRDNNE